MVPLEVIGAIAIVTCAAIAGVLTLYFLRTIALYCYTGRPASAMRISPPRLIALVALYLFLVLALSIFSSVPSYCKQSAPLAQLLHQPTEDHPFSTALHHDYPEFVLLTFASDGYLDALLNAIGSYHVWAAGVPIVVHDMGLSPENAARVRRIRDVELVHCNYSRYPSHMRYLHNYAFKPLLIYETAQKYEAILALDAGIELHQTLRPVFAQIRAVGYFFIEASSVDPFDRVNPKTVQYLHLPKPSHDERQCYGGWQGYLRGSTAFVKVLAKAAECARHPQCIDPLGSGHENHRFEMSVLSLFVRQERMHCNVGELYNEHRPFTLHPDSLALHQPQMFVLRRWRYPKPYARHLQTESMPFGFAFGAHKAQQQQQQQQQHGNGNGNGNSNSGSGSALFETGVTDRKFSGDALVQCLQRYEYDDSKCTHIQQEYENAAAKRPRLGSAEYQRVQERNGWFLAQSAWVYWHWPLTVGDAIFMIVIVTGLLLSYLLRDSSGLGSCGSGGSGSGGIGGVGNGNGAIIGVNAENNKNSNNNSANSRCNGLVVLGSACVMVLIYVCIKRSSVVAMCQPHQRIAFDATSWDFKQDPMLTHPHGSILCHGAGDPPVHLSSAPYFVHVHNMSPHMFYTMSAYDHTIVHYGIEDRHHNWHVGGVAFVSPLPLERPCVFTYNNTPYMLPHLPNERRILLYTTATFPTSWHVIRDLARLSAPATSMLYHVNSMWYLQVTTLHDNVAQVLVSESLIGPYTATTSAPRFTPQQALCSVNPKISV